MITCITEKKGVYLTDEPELLEPARILKTKMKLRGMIRGAVDEVKATNAHTCLTDFLRCLAILEYLNRNDIKSALAVYDDVINDISGSLAARRHTYLIGSPDIASPAFLAHSRTCALEEAIYEDMLLLLYRDICSNTVCQRGYLRQTLEAMLFKYPTNTLALSLYSWNERRFRIFSHVSRTLEVMSERYISWLVPETPRATPSW